MHIPTSHIIWRACAHLGTLVGAMLAPLSPLALFAPTLRADVTLPAILSNHAVLQRSTQTRLWGTAEPGEAVTITLASVQASTIAGENGTWSVCMDVTPLEAGPHELRVRGANELTVRDVVLGEVWLASGQSNMWLEERRCKDGAEHVANSENPMLREFHVDAKTSAERLDSVRGTWRCASPQTTARFSSVGYHFGKELQSALHVPVGIVHSSWAGSPSEAWTSMEALEANEFLRDSARRERAYLEGYQQRKIKYGEEFRAWEMRYARALPLPNNIAPYVGEGTSPENWKRVTLPGTFREMGLPDAGAIWFKRKLTLTREMLNTRAPIQFGSIPDGWDEWYWNGIKIAEKKIEDGGLVVLRFYTIAYKELGLEPGEGVMAFRVCVRADNGAILKDRKGPMQWGSNPLDGEWFAAVEQELPPLKPDAKAAMPRPLPPKPDPSKYPGYIYNAMIAPLFPFSIKGVIWYQGEANAGRGYAYREAFPTLIENWRAGWNNPSLPFLFCQLPGYGPKSAKPNDSVRSRWADLRESQSLTLALPHTSAAILIDLGETHNVHPGDKGTVGQRLAALALNDTYAIPTPCRGPFYQSHTLENNAIRISFSNAEEGLIAANIPSHYLADHVGNKTLPIARNSPQSQLEGFVICGPNQKWLWANAQIDGSTVVVSHPNVPNPIAVRYAWSDSPTLNLFNTHGLPAAPFRTDSFLLPTQNIR